MVDFKAEPLSASGFYSGDSPLNGEFAIAIASAGYKYGSPFLSEGHSAAPADAASRACDDTYLILESVAHIGSFLLIVIKVTLRVARDAKCHLQRETDCAFGACDKSEHQLPK